MARSENLTIMFTDIVGYTKRTSSQSRADNAAMLREHDRLLLPLVANFGGRRVKSIGDAMLVTFRSPTDAVRCGMALQDALTERRRLESGGEPLRIRVALALGDVRIEAGDVFGEAVNVAARIESLTPPDEVYIGQSVYLAMNRAEVPTERVGDHELKGIPERVQIYRVPPHDEGRASAGDGAYFPFGGMHRSRSESSSVVARTVSMTHASAGRILDTLWAHTVRAVVRVRARGLIAACGLIVLVSVSTWAWSGASDDSMLVEAQRLMGSGDLKTVEATANTLLQENPKSAEAQLLLGHVTCARKQRKRCLEHYRVAFTKDESLSGDPVATRSIVETLGWEGDAAKALLNRFPSAAARTALLERTSRPGYWGRSRAVEVLDTLGEGAGIDRVQVAIADLQDGPSCAKRRQAVRLLGELGDARAVPALRAASSGSTVFDKNRCLRDDAKTILGRLAP